MAKKTTKKTGRKVSRRTAKKTTRGGRTKRGVRASASSVRVRMYRQGFGDCFLLVLPSSGTRPYYLMIDCGVLLGTPNQQKQMQKVVRDIIDTTGGHVDLLVVTHEHWDHLSGFLQAKDLFADGSDTDSTGKLHIRDLWLAWTEDPNDELANVLRGQRKKTEQGLRLALQRLRAAEFDETPAAAAADEDDEAQSWNLSKQVDSLLGFFGAAGRSTSDALASTRGLAQSEPRYCRPSDQPIHLPQVDGVRIYVLGPPQDEKLIKKSHPSKAHPEVYHMAFGMAPGDAFLAAALEDLPAGDESFAALREVTQPFDETYCLPLVQAEQMPFFQRQYWGEAEADDYRDQAWRRIDADWLGASAELALKLDDDTNNTSLALAIELLPSGRVLLFPGDAQVGNWLSWENVEWTLDCGEKTTAHDLLARTVLYKVGHHGSHNATLRDKGLELMNHPELTAMVPVDQDRAKAKRWHKIPFEPLLTRLAEKTNGRILRVDDKKKVSQRKAPENVPASVWKKFQKRVTQDNDLFFEYEVEL